ncbi:recombinase family protein [Nocardioides ginsengisoli]|uniref:Recombinase family protein n=1 Tax=Nocardioides ginsengisoli TaxID=363868 RepID=A0ABW3W1N0_9ACTN
MTTKEKRSESRRAAIYARISNDKQKGKEGEGLGVQRQLEDCRDLAQRLGLTVVAEFVDNDISAHSGRERPEYLAMLDEVKAGRIDVVVAWHTDRLHRLTRELEKYIEHCEPHNVETHTVKAGHVDLSTATGRMVAKILGSIAQQESEQKIERMKAAYRQRAKTGRAHIRTHRPFGWDDDGLTLRQEEAGAVEFMTRSIIKGESIASIARDLNGQGLRTSRGREWTVRSVREVAMRPRNAGLVQYDGQILDGVTGEWQAIVSESDFRTVLSILKDPKRRTNTDGTAIKHLLPGIAMCGKCGAPCKYAIVHHTKAGKPSQHVYRCSKSTCVVRDEKKLDNLVTRVALMLLLNQKMRKALAPRDGEGPDYLTERDRINEQLDELAAAYGRGTFTLSQVETASTALRERMQVLDGLIATQTRGDTLREMLSVPDLVQAWEQLPLSRKREVIRSLMTVQVMPIGKGNYRNVKFHQHIKITLVNDVLGDEDLTAAILAHRLTSDQERAVVRAFAA